LEARRHIVIGSTICEGEIAMKKRFVIVALLAFGAAMVFAQAARFNPGAVTTTAGGYFGDMRVEVVFNANEIVSIAIVEHNDTPVFANMVAQRLVPVMLETQSHDVDIIAGATYTSEGLIEAVRLAIAQATRS